MTSQIENRLATLDWGRLQSELSETGHVLTPPLMTPEECAELVAMYTDTSRFRSHIIMARYRFGSGDYKYFAHPLPKIVREMRTQFYPHLAAVANDWNERLGAEERFPPHHEQFLELCHGLERALHRTLARSRDCDRRHRAPDNADEC